LVDLLNQKARESTKSVYANGLQLGVTELDLKITFGEGQQPTNWHTAVTMPWMLAKALKYYLESNLAVHEITNGTVKLPAGLLPATLPAPNDMDTNPTSKKVFEVLQSIRKELMDEQLPLHANTPSPR
jgi:hypothetical protein